MFQKLFAALESANFKSAVRHVRLGCPGCASAPSVIPAAQDDVIRCEKCGTAASALEWSAGASAQKLIGKADEPPASTKIIREDDSAGTVSWTIPASAKSGGLMFFAAFWCGITGVLTLGAVFARWEGGGPPPAFPLVLFFALFWTVGIGMAYAACRSKYARHRLAANRDTVTLRRMLFGRTTERSLPTPSVQNIEAVEFYQSNYQPVHGIEIRGSQGKLRFGSMLTEQEKAWLVADLKRVVLGSAPETELAAAGRSAPAGRRAEFISVLLPLAPKRWLGPGLTLLVIGIAFILVGIFAIDPQIAERARPSSEGNAIDLVFGFVFGGFRVMWIGSASLFAVAGVVMLIRYSRTRNQQTRLEGTREEIVLRTTNAGRIFERREFPKGDVLDVRASVVGSSNGKPMKRIELLIGGKAHLLGRWFDGEKADAFVAEARRALFS